jgi:hypothetical protein
MEAVRAMDAEEKLQRLTWIVDLIAENNQELGELIRKHQK